ncbi:MAG: Maf family protein [Chlamydiota bacterium]
MFLILASSSPRRLELLRAAGIEFTVESADLPEIPHPGEPPQQFAERMAREKAHVVAQRHRNPGEWVLAADTVVFVNGEILGKPADAPDPAADAARMLRLLSGREHCVITGVCLLSLAGGRSSLAKPVPSSAPNDQRPATNDFFDVRSETTRVWMDALSEEDIRDYIATGEPMDKAGAYAIQGRASRWIPRIEGCYFNVVGLPVPLVYRMLRERGVVC